MDNERIQIAGSLIPDTFDTPLDARTRVNVPSTDLTQISEAIVELGNPFVGQLVYNIATEKFYLVKRVFVDNLGFHSVEIAPFENNSEGGSSSEDNPGGSGTTPTPSGQTRINYSSTLEEGNCYISPRLDNNYAVIGISSSGTSRCLTKAIPVNIGDKIIFSGNNKGAFCTVVGYESENESAALNGRHLDNVTILLGYGANGNADTGTLTFSNETIEITSSTIKYIRCAGLANNSWKVELIKSETSSVPDDDNNNNNNTNNNTITTKVVEYAIKAFVPDGKKIMICGASFADNGSDPDNPNSSGIGNGWDKLVYDATGIDVINKAKSGSDIRYMAKHMIDANNSQRHGSLFMYNEKDIFDEIGTIIIMYTHNDNSLLDEASYKTRTVDWYKRSENASELEDGPLASSFDYVIKQIKEWCKNYFTDSDSSNNQNLELVRNQIQILICSNWHPGREYYNESSRLLAARHNLAYCPLDTELGFSRDNIITDTAITDKIYNKNGLVKIFNSSILHCQHTMSNHETVDNGRVEYITDKEGNEVAWGWHPQRWTPTINNKSIDYGYGTAVTWKGSTFAVPWIQRAIANSIVNHLNFNPVQEID